MRKLRNFSTDRCYHLISRVANKAFYFTEEERGRFVERMWRVAYFTCVEVLAYCVMSNHFHILVYVPACRKLNEEEILSRIRTLYTGARLEEILKEWNNIVARDLKSRKKEFLNRYTRRMWNASEFMKTLKQITSQSFNSRLRHDGTMWESRFYAKQIMSDEKIELMRIAGYIDRNPVKAGIVKWPDEYQWCSFSAASAGDVRAREGYRFIYTFAPIEWPRTKELHECSIGIAIRELEEDSEIKDASGSYGGRKFSVTCEKIDGMKRRRLSKIEECLPDYVPRILPCGNNRVARDILDILSEKSMRPMELRKELGINSANYFTSQYLTPMKREGYIEIEKGVNMCNSRVRYVITSKGRRVLK